MTVMDRLDVRLHDDIEQWPSQRTVLKYVKEERNEHVILSTGFPLISHWMLGLGFPLARHTRRPFSSGASTRLMGLSSQYGAAVEDRESGWHAGRTHWHVCVNAGSLLTFDLDKDGVAYAAQVIVGHAHILPCILLWHTDDLQGLVIVLKLGFVCWQVSALLEPLDGGCRTVQKDRWRTRAGVTAILYMPLNPCNS